MENHYLQRMLGDHEKVVLATRQHGFVLFRAILVEILIALGIIIVTSLLAFLQIDSLRSLNFPFGIGYLFLILPILSGFRDVLLWNNHMYIVTNRRVIQLSGVFNKDVIDSSLEKVNDVKMEQSFLGRIFNFGDIEILTASELGANLFKRIGNPIGFKTAMLNAKELLERLPTQVVEKSAMPDFPAMITSLDKLRQQGLLTEEEFQQKKKDLLAKM
jgi:uncharacterized membrane protein YdbT with pleckstrin-like domain